ncbi:hypothetical protein WN48_04490 [Eufriesea mexicana]|nr:hypothetical protein WN48_04490 [Eufriesea mexicana]
MVNSGSARRRGLFNGIPQITKTLTTKKRSCGYRRYNNEETRFECIARLFYSILFYGIYTEFYLGGADVNDMYLTMTGFLAELTYNELEALLRQAINETTPYDWKGFCKHVGTLEHEYWTKDEIIEDATEDLELEIQSSESDKESDDNSSKIYKVKKYKESKVNILLGRVYALASISCVCLTLSRCFVRFLRHVVFYDRANRKGSVLPIREAFYSTSAMMLEWLDWWGFGPTSFSDDFFSATQSMWCLLPLKLEDQNNLQV